MNILCVSSIHRLFHIVHIFMDGINDPSCMHSQSLFELYPALGKDTCESNKFRLPRLPAENLDEQTFLRVGIACIGTVLDVSGSLFYKTLQTCFDSPSIGTDVVSIMNSPKSSERSQLNAPRT